jgi:hypothetical protein
LGRHWASNFQKLQIFTVELFIEKIILD